MRGRAKPRVVPCMRHPERCAAVGPRSRPPAKRASRSGEECILHYNQFWDNRISDGRQGGGASRLQTSCPERRGDSCFFFSSLHIALTSILGQNSTRPAISSRENDHLKLDCSKFGFSAMRRCTHTRRGSESRTPWRTPHGHEFVGSGHYESGRWAGSARRLVARSVQVGRSVQSDRPVYPAPL